MRWLRMLGVVLLMLVAVGVLISASADLPPLSGRTQSRAFAHTEETALGRAFRPQADAHAGLSGIHLLPGGLDAFASRALLARSAERSIDAQYYIWRGDLTGTLLFHELIAAADRGVRVRLLLDDNPTKGLDDLLASVDAHPNIEVRLFNPFVLRKLRVLGYLTDFDRLNRRMHNKSFTVDNQMTIIGGRNVGDEYFDAAEGALFVDLDVLAVGPVVGAVSKDFDRYWRSASSYPASRILGNSGAQALADGASRAAAITRSREARDYLAAAVRRPLIAQLASGQLSFEWSPVRLISDDPAKGLGRAGAGELLISRLDDLLQSPRTDLNLVSGDFVPTKRGVEVLTAIRRRGVRVAVVTNSLEATDVPIVHAGYAKWRRELLQAGITIWEIKASAAGHALRSDTAPGSGGSASSGAGSALHAKTFSVDGQRLFVGSFNFDPRSARLNTELGFVISSPALAREIDSRLSQLVAQGAYEVELSDSGKPLWKERIGQRIATYRTEPGTTPWQRFLVRLLSLLPIEWML